MSTIAPPSKPLSPALVDSEHYIDDQIRRTRRALKLVDLAAGLITLAIGLLAFVLLAAVLDHWVVPGGMNTAGRGLVFGLMLLAVAWYGWRQFVPLLRSINPVYAAHTIERSTPSLKNSLLNLLMFRTHRQQMSTRVYHALEQQAAQRLSTAPLDTAIDRSALLRLGYALLLIIAVCAAYAVLSPKNMAVSAARVLAPWSDLAPPSRVKILDVKPGATSVARGERLEISAEVNGLHADESVRLRYSTADETLVDESITMKRPTAEARRFQSELPRGGDATVAAGVEKDLVYWIEAGDARSKKFKVMVFERPTLVVQKVRYEYPAYTGYPTAEVGNTGDVRGLEGTQVTISALANQPIKSAYVDFDADGRSDLKMTVEGDRATASFALALREDRRTPMHDSYILKFTSVDGRKNLDPPKYDIDVTPDYAPEVRVTEPAEPELTVRVDETVPIAVEARDPDFALSGVRLMGKVGDREATLIELLTRKHEGRYGAKHMFTPGDVKLKPGDVLEYWAEARDNRRPEANVALSEHRRLKIAGPADQPQKNQKNGEPASAGRQNGEQKDGEKGEGGQQGQGGPQQPGDQGGDSEGSEGEGEQGPGGAGADGKQGDKSQSQEGTGGQGGTGESQSNDPQQQQEQEGGAGGSSASNADQSQNAQEQPSQGANNGAGNSGQSQAGQQKPQPGANPGESASAGGANEQTQPGAQGQPGNPDGAQAGEQSGEPQGDSQEKVSSEGDDDGTAFQKLAEQLKKQDGGEQSGEAGAEGEKPGAKTQAEGRQRDGQQQGDQAAGDPKQDAGQGADGKQGQSPQDKPSAATGQSGKPSGQKPPAEGAQPEGPAENATDAEQQGAAGQNPSKREGADAPRETKNGDGNPNDPQGRQPTSADSQMNRNDGNAGSGHNAGEQDAAPGSEESASRGKEKTDADNRQGADDQEAPSGASDKQESDSKGGQGGDRSGGGQKGAGQKADAAGKGAAGRHEAADEGAGRAEEQGEGETGSKAGGEQLAEGKTGESSGDQPGKGTQQGKSGESASAGGPEGQQPGAKSEPKAGEQPGGEQAGPQGAGGDKQEQPAAGGQPPQEGAKTQAEGAQPGGEQGAGDPSAAKPPQAGEQPDSQDGKPGEQQPSQQPGTGGQAGSSQPQGGGQGGEMTASAQQDVEEAKEDAANLEFARKQTDLVLERLDQQLAKKQVDGDLLKSLGWSEAELQKFVDRWKGLKTRAANEGEDGEQAQQELDGALRSLGLRPQEPTRVRAGSKTDALKVKDSYRSRAPIEYAERVNRYRKNLSTSGSDKGE